MSYFDPCKPTGDIADYRLDYPMNQKCINLYVIDVPMLKDEAEKFAELVRQLPKGLPYGVRTRVWHEYLPETLFMGEMVSYSVYNELGEAVELMIPYTEFDMASVPWEEIIV